MSLRRLWSGQSASSVEKFYPSWPHLCLEEPVSEVLHCGDGACVAYPQPSGPLCRWGRDQVPTVPCTGLYSSTGLAQLLACPLQGPEPL